MTLQQIIINERVNIVMALREYGYTHKVIGEILGQSERNIQNYVSKAKAKAQGLTMRNLPDNPDEYLSPSKRGKDDLLESRRDRAKAREGIDLFKRNYREEEILIRLFGKVTPYRVDWLARHLRAAGVL